MSSRIPSKCIEWFKYPQLSITGSIYKLGDPNNNSAWKNAYKECARYVPEYYKNIQFNPVELLDFVDKQLFRPDSYKDKLDKQIENMPLEIFKKYLSSCIIAYGILLSDDHRLILKTPKDRLKFDLQEFYEMIYELYSDEHNLTDEQLDDTIDPIDFLKLNDSNFKNRYSRGKNQMDIPDDVCIAKSNIGCANALGGVKNDSLFYPLANAIKCYCDMLRVNAVIVPTTNTGMGSILESVDYQDMNKVKEFDFRKIAFDLSNQMMYVSPETFSTFGIELKTKENCLRDPLFYINQIHEEVYTVYEIRSPPKLEMYFTSIILQTTEYIDETTGETYQIYEPPHQYQFYHKDESGKKIADPVVGPGPIINLYDDIGKELFAGKLFVAKEGIFNTERYIINSTKKYNYEYIGVLFRFLLLNRIGIPFKLSRAYILKLFDLYSFEEDTKDMYEQLVLITIYILETDVYFKNTIIQIFKKPDLLNDKSFCLESGIFSYPSMMNDRNDIVSENREIYNNDKNVYLYNLIQFLYKNAIMDYFGSDNAKAFFKGFGNVMFFDDYILNCKSSSTPDVAPVFPLPKLELFMSGIQLSMKTIEERLIPLIERNIKPSRNSKEATINRMYELMIDVLKNINKYQSNVFKQAYDEKFQPPIELSPEQYHLEFVKYLLKYWTGSTNINEQNYYGIVIKTGSRQSGYRLPLAATCSAELKFQKIYETSTDLYDDLVYAIIENNFGTDFGQL